MNPRLSLPSCRIKQETKGENIIIKSHCISSEDKKKSSLGTLFFVYHTKKLGFFNIFFLQRILSLGTLGMWSLGVLLPFLQSVE